MDISSSLAKPTQDFLTHLVSVLFLLCYVSLTCFVQVPNWFVLPCGQKVPEKIILVCKYMYIVVISFSST